MPYDGRHQSAKYYERTRIPKHVRHSLLRLDFACGGYKREDRDHGARRSHPAGESRHEHHDQERQQERDGS